MFWGIELIARMRIEDGPKIPQYIHFTLQKTNRDTQDCITHISRQLHIDSRFITTAGTKDKRGVTVQRVCVQRKGMKLKEMWNTINGLKGLRRSMKQVLEERGEKGMRVGDMCYSDEYIELGMLRGNHFNIILR